MIGGTDITNVIVVSRAQNDTTGAGSVTDVGFQGNFMNILIGEGNQAINAVTGTYNLNIGAVADSTHEWVFGGTSENLGSNLRYIQHEREFDCVHVKLQSHQWQS